MTPNTLFPGRPDYVGPTAGWFALLHHDTLFERSHNVNERIAYVRRNKSENEVALRLHNMVYLGAVADICVARAAIDADYGAKRAAIDAEVLAYVRSVVPGCAWNGTKLEGT